MKLISRKYLLKADIDNVVRCFTELESVAESISYVDKEARVRPEVKRDGLYLIAKKPMMKVARFTVCPDGMYSTRVTLLSESLKRFGELIVNCSFSVTEAGTSVVTILESEKTPKLLWRIFIRFIVLVLLFQSRAEEKKYIEWVENNA